ncbi:MAG: hypothetical protein KA408_01425 [Flavobacteriales bacterium]|nr:hypothetical protein [Flavobacteriales bacterium]
MKRTKSEIIKELNQTQNVLDRLTMEIGQSYARASLSHSNEQIAAINQKVATFKKAEAQLRVLEEELANTLDDGGA